LHIMTICDKLIPPLRTQFCNFTQVSLQVTSNMNLPSHENCSCTKTLPDCGDLVDDHVVTVNYNAIPNKHLRHLFWQGSKYRMNFNRKDVVHAVTLGLMEYVNKICSRTHASDYTRVSTQLQTWQDVILSRVSQNVLRYNHTLQPDIPSYTYTALKHLQEHFVICPVDKTSHNLAICCKHWYLYRLSKELDSPSYESVQDPPQQILARHAAWNQEWGYKHANILPYLYYVLKAHKTPATGRGIAGVTSRNKVSNMTTSQSSTQQRTSSQTAHDTSSSSTTDSTPVDSTPATDNASQQSASNASDHVKRIHSLPVHKPYCSTTTSSTKLSYALQGVIKTLKEKDVITFNEKGYRRCWIVQSVDEVISEIKSQPSILP
jgi:hypothetical protein